MIIQLRSIGRAEPDDVAAILPTLSEAAAAVGPGAIDRATLREEQGRDYLDRVRYLMADYSSHVLARAKERVSEYAHLVRHYEGILVAQDLFAGDVSQYASYRGPGKLEGSNISLLSAPHRDAYRRPNSHHDDHELATEARDAGFGAVA